MSTPYQTRKVYNTSTALHEPKKTLQQTIINQNQPGTNRESDCCGPKQFGAPPNSAGHGQNGEMAGLLQVLMTPGFSITSLLSLDYWSY